MAKKNLNSLISSAGKLKTTKRAGWVKKVSIENAESVADHTFRMAVIGVCIGEMRGLDSGKIAVMCLIHDLAESRIGDLTPDEKTSEEEHRMLEDKVMKEIFSTVPKRARKKIVRYWKELLNEKSKEARLVWKLDKLEMGLQMKDYARIGHDKSLLAEFDPSRSLSRDLREILQNYS